MSDTKIVAGEIELVHIPVIPDVSEVSQIQYISRLAQVRKIKSFVMHPYYDSIGNVQFWLTLWQFCALDGVLIIASKDEFKKKNHEKFVKLCLHSHSRTIVYICQLISAICLHLSAGCLQF